MRTASASKKLEAAAPFSRSTRRARTRGRAGALNRHDYDASLLFATLLGKQLKARGLQYARQYTEAFMGKYQHELVNADFGIYRYDQLIVLKETKIPLSCSKRARSSIVMKSCK
jgi:hypothetical protein